MLVDCITALITVDSSRPPHIHPCHPTPPPHPATHLERQVQRVEELEVCGALAGADDGVGQVHSTRATLPVVLRHRRVVSACRANQRQSMIFGQTQEGVGSKQQLARDRRRGYAVCQPACLPATQPNPATSQPIRPRRPPQDLPAASASWRTSSSSASESVAKRLMATTTGTPNRRALEMCFARLQQPARSRSRSSAPAGAGGQQGSGQQARVGCALGSRGISQFP